MKFNMTLTAAEIVSVADIVNQIIPDSVDLEKIMPDPGKTKITTIKNQKILIEAFENSDVVSVKYDLDAEFVVAIFDMLGGFASNITGACKALMKHGKLLISLMGTEEIIQKINGMVVGKDCDAEGNPITSDTDDDDNAHPHSDNEDEEAEVAVAEKFESPITDTATNFGFNV